MEITFAAGLSICAKKAVKLILSTEFAGSVSEIGINAPFAGWLTVTVAVWSYDKKRRKTGLSPLPEEIAGAANQNRVSI